MPKTYFITFDIDLLKLILMRQKLEKLHFKMAIFESLKLPMKRHTNEN